MSATPSTRYTRSNCCWSYQWLLTHQKLCVRYQLKRDAERTDAEQVSHETREALAMSLDGLSCAVESLTHFARAFDEHKRSLPHAMSLETTGTQQPHGATTQDSVEKLVRSVLTHVHLGFNTLQRSLGQVEHHGDPLHREAPPSKDKEAQGKAGRVRRNSINVESLEDEGDVGSFGHEGLKAGRGYAGRVQFADQVGPAP